MFTQKVVMFLLLFTLMLLFLYIVYLKLALDDWDLSLVEQMSGILCSKLNIK